MEGDGAREIERKREKSNSLFLWGCSLGMKCGGLRGTRADKKVQIGKSEQDPSHSHSFLLIPSAQSFSFFIYIYTPLIHPLLLYGVIELTV